ncbi:chaperone protein ClpB3 chloroplastic-like protein, partial [Tanacetum coccineum]
YGGQLTDLPSNIKALLAAKDNVLRHLLKSKAMNIWLLAVTRRTAAFMVINKIKELAASIKGKTLVEKSNASNMETERCQPKRSHMGGMISLTLDFDTLQFRRRQKARQKMAWQSIVLTGSGKGEQTSETEHLLKAMLEEKNELARGIFSKADVD